MRKWDCMSTPEAPKPIALTESDKKLTLTPEIEKEANRLFWSIKGALIPQGWNEENILSVYKSYQQRASNSGEAWVHEDGFEEAWKARMTENS